MHPVCGASDRTCLSHKNHGQGHVSRGALGSNVRARSALRPLRAENRHPFFLKSLRSSPSHLFLKRDIDQQDPDRVSVGIGIRDGLQAPRQPSHIHRMVKVNGVGRIEAQRTEHVVAQAGQA